MKKKKLVISELEVKSFVTSFHNNKENTIKGGISGSACTVCDYSATCPPASDACFTADGCTLPGIICNTYPGPGGNNKEDKPQTVKIGN